MKGLLMHLYFKWFVVVGLNATLGFMLGSEEGKDFEIAMIGGILTWYFVYLCFDNCLQKNGYINISRKLFISAILRIPLQFLIMPDMYAGLAAIITTDFIGIENNSFLLIYSRTIFTGLYLSLMCSVIYLIITGIEKIWHREKADK